MRAARIAFILPVLLLVGGCELFQKKKLPPPVEFPLASPYAEVRTIAIAPALNLSGNRDFDPLAVSDTLFSEMQQVQGLNVLPLNRTLLAMQRLGVRSIEDVKTAQRVAELLNADGLVIPAITAYDPYKPPSVGMVLQMYTPRVQVLPGATTEPARSNAASSASDLPVEQRQPVSQVNAVLNAGNQSVRRELHNYAAGRTDYDSALQEEKFLMDADAYMRFVCHAMVRRLMDVERSRPADR